MIIFCLTIIIVNVVVVAVVIVYLLSKFTEQCDIECENGGTVNTDCSCQCAYGLEGKSCKQLSRRKLFTDESCGIHSEEQGTISLR